MYTLCHIQIMEHISISSGIYHFLRWKLLESSLQFTFTHTHTKYIYIYLMLDPYREVLHAEYYKK